MVILSLFLNIAILIPVCIGLMLDAGWVQSAYGPHSPARGILLSAYLAIGLASIILLFKMDPRLIAVLLFIQVIYKCTTPFTVGTFNNPVVISNLCIAAFHSLTLFVIWKSGALFAS